MKQKNLISIIVLFLFLIGSNTVMAQKPVPNQIKYDQKRLHFGFYLGGNQMLFSVKMRPGFANFTYYQNQIPEFNADSAHLLNVTPIPQFGFTIGIVSSLTMGKYFNLRFTPELLFSERKLRYNILTYYRDKTVLIENFDKNIPSTHLNFPLYLKYKGVRLHNARPYIFVGIKLVIDLAAQAGKVEDENERNIVVKLYRSDIAFEAGVGFDFYFNWFKMGTELRMSYGLNDVLKNENNIYTDPIDSIHSRIFQLVFTFE